MGNVNENIRDFRKFRGLSQKELGQMLNKSTNVVSNWENGLHSPDLDTLEKMCRILNVTPNQMFGWEKNAEYVQWLEKQSKMRFEIERMTNEKKDLEKRIAAYTAALNKVTNDIDVDDLEEQED